ncbi:MAG: alpha-amylase family glycosyl hydrolase [Bacillus subtilis]|nr:alpha-amylase family glycosyl hydrolase [Bacillus subtilis]
MFCICFRFTPSASRIAKERWDSPYSIQDYRAISPDLGDFQSFAQLIEATHRRGMKLMMDVVFNHTSRDSKLLKEHPEWLYKNASGAFANRVGEWWDVTDFDYTRDRGLWVELADTLKMYAAMGVDGFRCDVASLVPLEFWKYARKIVRKAKKNVIWLSESIHGGFLKYIRDSGFSAWSEAEIYQAFDLSYDYDVHPYYEAYLQGKRPLRDYLEALRRQEETYPANYVKLKNVENHDVERLAKLVCDNPKKIRNWLALSFFQKAAVMLYAGTEFQSNRRPDLFEKDVFTRVADLTPFIQRLTKIKHRPIFSSGIVEIHLPDKDGVAYLTFKNAKEEWHGIFNVGQIDGVIAVSVPGRHVSKPFGRISRCRPRWPNPIGKRTHLSSNQESDESGLAAFRM